MKPLHRNLLIILGVTVLVYGGLLWAGRSMSESSAHVVGENVVQGPRAQKLNSVEAQELLKKIIIPTVNLENATLAEALDFVNAEIAKQIPEGHPRPKVMIDPVFLKSDRHAHEAAVADESLKEALGGIALKPASDIQIEELRLRNVPADVLIKYICAATVNWYYIYEGDVLVSGFCEECSRYSFRNDKIFDRIRLDAVRADRLVRELGAIIDSCEYRGRKAGISIWMSENARLALVSGKCSMPVISLDLHNVSLAQMITVLAEQSDGSLMARSPEMGGLIYDPLKEGIGILEDPFNDAEPRPGGRFDILMDESWYIPLDVDWDKNQSKYPRVD